MNTRTASIFSATLIGLSISASANATLIDRGNGMVYDTDQNITWLQDANYAKTSNYDADGLMNWYDAMAWASNLTHGGFGDWRLPTAVDTGAPGCDWANNGTDCGYNVDTSHSELAYMYHVNLGLESGLNEDGSIDPTWGIYGNGTLDGVNSVTHGQNDVGLIKNIQAWAYWSGSEDALGGNGVWQFFTSDGTQIAFGKDSEFYAWAVRDGDVISQTGDAITLPEPSIVALMALGLIATNVARRRNCGRI